MKYRLPRGTKDILPAQTPLWQKVERVARDIFKKYNYQEIRTPIFESTELFVRSIGKATDIVYKEMFTFNETDESYSLRPEATAPVVRAVIEGGLISQGGLVKLYYLGPMFRKERPQKGRLRQFHQIGVEAFGSDDPRLEVEQISLNLKLFEALDIKDLTLEINSLGCEDDKKKYQAKLTEYFSLHKKELCHDCERRLKENPLRVLDCKVKECQRILEAAPASKDSLCPDCEAHFNEVLVGLQGKYNLNHRLVRGLDYYTGTTFEIKSKSLGAQNAISGGGRYDRLVEEFGGKPTAAVGFALGIERLMLLLDKKEEAAGLSVFLATMGEKAQKEALAIMALLREKDIAVDTDYLGRSLKAQMREANRLKARFVLILGDDELHKGIIVLKDMEQGTQADIPLSSLSAILLEHIH